MARPDIKIILTAQARALGRAGGTDDADLLDQLAAEIAAEGTLNSAVDNSLQITDELHTDGSVERTLVLLNDLLSVLETAAKKNVLADLGRVAAFLERHRTMSLAQLLAKFGNTDAKPAEPSAAYGERLKSLLGEAGFEDLLSEALQDKKLKQPDLVAIAEAMGSEVPARTSKKKVAERLLSRHRSLATFKAKQRAMAGRSAA